MPKSTCPWLGWILAINLSSSSSVAAIHEATPAINITIDIDSMTWEPFYKGFYGRAGMVSLFIAPKTILGNDKEIYWSMVHVLSKKYGCFMTRKMRKNHYTAFKCKDKRVIVFKTKSRGKQIIISGRQFDDKGREIIVRNRQIVARFSLKDRDWPTVKE